MRCSGERGTYIPLVYDGIGERRQNSQTTLYVKQTHEQASEVRYHMNPMFTNSPRKTRFANSRYVRKVGHFTHLNDGAGGQNEAVLSTKWKVLL